jgi:hypothetical protein
MDEDKVFKLNAQDRGVVRFGIRYRSKMHIGDNTTMYMRKHYNWFRKLMYKLCFDIKIEDVDVDM